MNDGNLGVQVHVVGEGSVAVGDAIELVARLRDQVGFAEIGWNEVKSRSISFSAIVATRRPW